MEEAKLEQITGTVESITYRNEESGFTVMDLNVNGELVTTVGEMLDIAEGEEVQATGTYTTHATYGLQFKAQAIQRRLPATAAAIYKYLASGAIKGIGPVLAQRLIDAFGDNTLEVLEKDPLRLSRIQGISPKKAKGIMEEFSRMFGMRTVMLFLSRFQIDPATGIQVWKLWGNLAPQVIEDNPYRLCSDEVGIDFEKADEIFATLDKDPESPLRLSAAIEHVLRHNAKSGHTCLPKDQLLEISTAFLDTEKSRLELILDQLVEDETVCLLEAEGMDYLYLPELYYAEGYAAGRINVMLGMDNPIKPTFENEINLLQQTLGIQYATKQRQAIAGALGNNVFLLTGGPGTGKTTTLNGILELLEQQGLRVELAAPTGRAAKRMTELTGRSAKTIHRLLEVEPGSPRNAFKHNERNLLRCDALIVDEMSMVDTLLFSALLRGVKIGCKLILVGDADQLPSVGPGNLLADLLACGCVACVHLDEIFRQAGGSLIVTNAHDIVHGRHPQLEVRDNDFFFMPRHTLEGTAQTVVELCAQRLPKSYGYSPFGDIQVLAPSRKGIIGTENLNRLLQERLNPSDGRKTQCLSYGRVFREGDKVMQIKNNYDIAWTQDKVPGMGVFNGALGVITMIDPGSKTMLIKYEDRLAQYSFEMLSEIEHAYAITVHKSQGSEFEAVVLPLAGYHKKLHYRNILYTAVTRAKKLLILLGQAQTIYNMVENNRRTLRYTNLRYLLQNKLGV